MSSHSSALYEECLKAERAYWRGQTPDRRPCLELFRRAIWGGDDTAWKALLDIYAPQVTLWVNTHILRSSTSLTTEDLMHRAWVRFWQALSSEHHQRDQGWSLGQLMAFLKRCVDGAIRDACRKERRDLQITSLEELSGTLTDRAPDMAIEVLKRMEQEDLWQQIRPLLKDDRERLVVELRYRQGIPPREICRLYPHLFTTSRDVYSVLRNVIRRLQRQLKEQELRSRKTGPDIN